MAARALVALRPKILKDPKPARKEADPGQWQMREKARAMRFWNSCFRKLQQQRMLKNKDHDASVPERNPRNQFVKHLVQRDRRIMKSHTNPSENSKRL